MSEKTSINKVQDGPHEDSTTAGNTDESPRISRRAALVKLGLAAGAVYMAPTLLSLSEASASGRSRRSRRSWGSRRSRGYQRGPRQVHKHYYHQHPRPPRHVHHHHHTRRSRHYYDPRPYSLRAWLGFGQW